MDMIIPEEAAELILSGLSDLDSMPLCDGRYVMAQSFNKALSYLERDHVLLEAIRQIRMLSLGNRANLTVDDWYFGRL
jgi:hypothetical protein